MSILSFALHILVVPGLVLRYLDTIRYSISKHRFILIPLRGSSTADRGPKSKLGTRLLLYHSLLNRDCNLVFAALLPSLFSPAQDAHL
jgi:hypothetical protein